MQDPRRKSRRDVTKSPRRRGLSLFHWNCNGGTAPRVVPLKSKLMVENPDVAFITEVHTPWPDLVAGMPAYRSVWINGAKDASGGVLMLLRRTINFKNLQCSPNAISVQIDTGKNRWLHVGGVYCPPDIAFAEALTPLLQRMHGPQVVIIGDFNTHPRYAVPPVWVHCRTRRSHRRDTVGPDRRRRATEFVQLAAQSDLRHASTTKRTFFGHHGGSYTDGVLLSTDLEARMRAHTCMLKARYDVPDATKSDHIAISCKVLGQSPRRVLRLAGPLPQPIAPPKNHPCWSGLRAAQPEPAANTSYEALVQTLLTEQESIPWCRTPWDLLQEEAQTKERLHSARQTIKRCVRQLRRSQQQQHVARARCDRLRARLRAARTEYSQMHRALLHKAAPSVREAMAGLYQSYSSTKLAWTLMTSGGIEPAPTPPCRISKQRLVQHCRQLYGHHRRPPALVVPSTFSVTADDVIEALARLKVHSAAGPDGLRPCMLARLVPPAEPESAGQQPEYPAMITSLVTVCNDVLLRDQKTWRAANESRIVPIPKTFPPSADPKDYRTLCVPNAIPKVVALMVHIALERRVESRGLLVENQNGFRRGRGPRDSLFVMQSLIHRAEQQSRPMYVLTLDIKKAFDWLPHDQVEQALVGMRLPNELRTAVSWILRSASMVARHKGRRLQIVPMRGTPQGCPLSPLLFICAINDVAAVMTSEFAHEEDATTLPATEVDGEPVPAISVVALLYADDIVLFAQSMALLQRMLSRLDELIQAIGLQFNAAKCVLKAYPRRTTQTLFLPSAQYRIGDSCDQIFLGAPLCSLNETTYARQREMRTQQAAARVRRHPMLYNCSFTVHEMLILVRAVLIGNSSYGSDALGYVVHSRTHQLPALDVSYNRALRATLGVHSSTLTDLLYLETGLLLPQAFAEKTMLNWLRAILCMPASRLPRRVLQAMFDHSLRRRQHSDKSWPGKMVALLHDLYLPWPIAADALPTRVAIQEILVARQRQTMLERLPTASRPWLDSIYRDIVGDATKPCEHLRFVGARARTQLRVERWPPPPAWVFGRPPQTACSHCGGSYGPFHFLVLCPALDHVRTRHVDQARSTADRWMLTHLSELPIGWMCWLRGQDPPTIPAHAYAPRQRGMGASQWDRLRRHAYFHVCRWMADTRQAIFTSGAS